MSEIEDRRQRAREAGYDMYDEGRDGGALFSASLEAAIEAATRVKITPEAIEAIDDAAAAIFSGPVQRKAVLLAGLAALGFEVVE